MRTNRLLNVAAISTLLAAVLDVGLHCGILSFRDGVPMVASTVVASFVLMMFLFMALPYAYETTYIVFFADAKAMSRVVQDNGPAYYQSVNSGRRQCGHSVVVEYKCNQATTRGQVNSQSKGMRKRLTVSQKPVVGETELEVLYWPGRPERVILRKDVASRLFGMVLLLVVFSSCSAAFGYAGFVLPIQIFFFGSPQGHDICPGAWHTKVAYFIAIVPFGAIPSFCAVASATKGGAY